MNLKKILTVVSLVTVVGTVAVVGMVSAQEPDTDTQPPAWEHRGPRGQFGKGGFGPAGEHRLNMHTLLAEALGLTVEDLAGAKAEGKTIQQLAEERGISLEDLQTTLKEAHLAAIDQAVIDGTLTQEQADQIKERIENGPQRGLDGPGFGKGRHGGRGGFGGPIHGSVDMHAVLAEALGLTVEDLAGAKAEGKTIQQLAEERGISLEDLQTTLKEAHLAAIDQAVIDGTLTQEQADQIKERIENGPQRGLDGPGFGKGRRGGRGGFGGFGPLPQSQTD